MFTAFCSISRHGPSHITLRSTASTLLPLRRASFPRCASVLSAPRLMARIVAGWVADGTAARLAAEKRSEMRTRNRRAREILTGIEVTGDPAAAHLWLTLPERWRA